MSLIVERAGFLTSVQDPGRTGFREFGVSLGGALDPFGLRVASLLVGNDEGAAGIEITIGGLRLRFEDDRLVAWCGGDFAVQFGSAVLPAGHGEQVKTGAGIKNGPSPLCLRCLFGDFGGSWRRILLWRGALHMG